VGRGRRAVQSQALDDAKQRRADGRLVQQGGQQSCGFPGIALSDAGARSRGPAPHGRYGRDHPAGEIAGALKSGAIDASEFVGPWTDVWLGLHKAAEYYYYPGFHEPGFNAALGINKNLWDGLTTSERAIVETAAQAEVTRSLAEFNAENFKSLKVLRADERIKIRRFNDELIKTFGKLSKEVLADTAAKDPLTRKVYDSYTAFLAGVMDWGELSETGYRDTRRLALG
jgi:TRAP-type mannitol/chloroaromatic compound transport system substrate-binding protein